MYKIYYYPKCSTCVKALKYLDNKGVKYEKIHLVEETPSEEELLELYKVGDYPIKKFFNTSGKVYKENGLKDIVGTLSKEKAFEMLSKEGMLIKRPILTNGRGIRIGFREVEWDEFIG